MRIIFQHLVDLTNEEILQRKVNLMLFYIAVFMRLLQADLKI